MKQKVFSENVLSGMMVVFGIILLLGVVFFYNKKNNDSTRTKDIQALIRQAARWTVASQQDKSPMIAVLHANYGAGYLQALETIATENEINQFTDLRKLRLQVYSTQDKAVTRAISACPRYLGEDIDKQLALLGVNFTNNLDKIPVKE